VTFLFSFDENVTLVHANRISNQNQQHAFERGKSVVAGKLLGGVLVTQAANQIRCERRSIVYT
jgi:hypothetical protein